MFVNIWYMITNLNQPVKPHSNGAEAALRQLHNNRMIKLIDLHTPFVRISLGRLANVTTQIDEQECTHGRIHVAQTGCRFRPRNQQRSEGHRQRRSVAKEVTKKKRAGKDIAGQGGVVGSVSGRESCIHWLIVPSLTFCNKSVNTCRNRSHHQLINYDLLYTSLFKEKKEMALLSTFLLPTKSLTNSTDSFSLRIWSTHFLGS